MSRLPVLAIASAATLLGALSPASAQMRGSAPFFTVELVQAASTDRAIAGGVLFSCEGLTCTAPRSRDRSLRVCSELRREVGAIASFSAGGTPLPESQLARCNG